MESFRGDFTTVETSLSFFPWVSIQKLPLPVAKIAAGVMPDSHKPGGQEF
jgi:hypothetical protein